MKPNRLFKYISRAPALVFYSLFPILILVGGLPRENATQDPPEPLPPPLSSFPQAKHGGVLLEGVPTYEDTLIELINQERWNNGQLPPLKRAPELDSASEDHSNNQAVRDFFGHCDLDTGSWPNDRMAAAGYYSAYWGENIAVGFGTPESVMAGWMGSSGHRANILSSAYQEVGVGHVYQGTDGAGVRKDLNTDCVSDGPSGWPYYHYWTQNFGRRNGVYPVVINREDFETTNRNVNLYVYGEGWAQEMRFCNAGRLWSEWEPYQPNKLWTLQGANGVLAVLAEVRSGSTVISSYDEIWLNETLKTSIEPSDKSIYLPVVAKPMITGEYCGFPKS